MFQVSIVEMALVLCAQAYSQGFEFRETPGHLDLLYAGKVWLRTMVEPYNPADREATYKVYTHIFDFEGVEPITKGPGGKYSHHRGMFIGWKQVQVGEKTYNIWEMRDGYQIHDAWLATEAQQEAARQVQRIRWNTNDGEPIIEEVRTISTRSEAGGVRMFDFASSLKTAQGPVLLRGDLHHAGMQVRLADEVSRHEESTQYILPDGAQELEGDKVVGAWWVCCSAEVRGKRYWIIHMTPKDHPTGEPVYSIRRYARFGAFFEADLEPGTPLDVRFRVAVSQDELSRAECERLYAEYLESGR